jgi:hypothetical protein
MVKCGVLFEVRTEFLNIIYTSLIVFFRQLFYLSRPIHCFKPSETCLFPNNRFLIYKRQTRMAFCLYFDSGFVRWRLGICFTAVLIRAKSHHQYPFLPKVDTHVSNKKHWDIDWMCSVASWTGSVAGFYSNLSVRLLVVRPSRLGTLPRR